MKRFLTATCVTLIVLGPARSADPKPVWEVGTGTAERKAFQVNWIGFSPDGKQVIARFDSGGERGREEERVAAWDAGTRTQTFDIHLGEWDATKKEGGAGALTGAGTVVLVGGRIRGYGSAQPCREVRLTDGKLKGLTIGQGADAVWIDADTKGGLWLLRDEDECHLAAGKLPAFAADPKQQPEGWVTTRLKATKDGYSVRSVTASADLKQLAVVADGERDRLLSLSTVMVGEALKLTELATVPAGHRGHVHVMRFSPSGKVLAIGSGDGSMSLWDVTQAGRDWRPRAALPLGNGTVSCLAFSPDGRTLAAGTFDKKGRPNLYLIDAPAGKILGRHRVDNEQVTALAYSPDGRTLVTGDNLGVVRAWDAAAIRGD